MKTKTHGGLGLGAPPCSECFCGGKGWVMLVGMGAANRKIACPDCATKPPEPVSIGDGYVRGDPMSEQVLPEDEYWFPGGHGIPAGWEKAQGTRRSPYRVYRRRITIPNETSVAQSHDQRS